jgi:protease IV
VMMKHDMVCGPVGTRTLANRLLHADGEPSVIGHVLVFETGGGTSNSVPELADAIRSCSKPVVAWVDGMMCSAGLFAGSYCREIIASRGTDLVGSIGTMIVYEGRKSLSGEDNDKVVHLRVYADEASEKNMEFESAINDFNVTLTKERVLNPHNREFVDTIRKNRPDVKEEFLHGRTFRASEVIGELVDAIGEFKVAVDRVVALSGFQPEQNVEGQQVVAANNVNQNFISMKYPNIMSVLGLDNESFVLEADGCRTFAGVELEAMENALVPGNSVGLDSAPAELQSQLDAANSLLDEREQRILELEGENTRLRQGAAEPPAIVVTGSDVSGADGAAKAVADKYDNPFDALSEVSEMYLGKKL